MKRSDLDEMYDAADAAYSECRQQMADAYAEGLRIGRMGLGAGLYPEGYGDDERDQWMKGYAAGAAEMINNRRLAA